jgi:3-oxoacyl-[acyl-carrier-protein] synthase II
MEEIRPGRAVVTGLGVISPLGARVTEFFKNLMDGRDGIGLIQGFDIRQYPVKTGGQVRDLEPWVPVPAHERGRLDRGAQLLLAATRNAITDAGLDFARIDPSRVSLVTGTTLGGMITGEQFYKRLLTNSGRTRSHTVRQACPHAANDEVMARWGLSGRSVVFSTACSASTHAVGYGLDLIRSGSADVVLAGGFEPFSELTLAGFGILRVLTPEKMRPFDRRRTGLLLGEGAGMIVLENRPHAEKRGATIYAALVGYGSTSDAYHMTAPHPQGEGAARAIQLALRDARLNVDDVDYINAHGTATPANDVTETQAIKTALGAHAYRVPVSSIKSMVGHLLGAAGAVEAVATVLSVYHSQIPPTMNYAEPDPACDLDYVAHAGREKKVRVALSNSFGFGGNNGVVVFRRI